MYAVRLQGNWQVCKKAAELTLNNSRFDRMVIMGSTCVLLYSTERNSGTDAWKNRSCPSIDTSVFLSLEQNRDWSIVILILTPSFHLTKCYIRLTLCLTDSDYVTGVVEIQGPRLMNQCVAKIPSTEEFKLKVFSNWDI